MSVKVLVVEDEEAVAMTLNAILTDDGYQVEEALTAAAALRLIESSSFDVALLDLRVGADDGLAILRRLKQVAPETVALILTGYGSLDTAIQAMRMGASDYLLKPCDVVELKSAITRGLELAGHHLKTPLTSVLGWTQYAQRQLSLGRTEEASEKLDLAIQHSRRIARLVEVFSDMVRVQHGLGLTREPANLRAVLELAVRAARASYAQHRFEPVLPHEPILALIDIAAVSTIFSSLLDNAAKFSPAGARVDVRLTAKGDDAVVSIRDRGVGISEMEIKTIFERYPQTGRGTPRGTVPGLGIGLHLSRALAEAHGGKIWAESAGSGKGSEFSVALPLIGSPANDSPRSGRLA